MQVKELGAEKPEVNITQQAREKDRAYVAVAYSLVALCDWDHDGTIGSQPFILVEYLTWEMLFENPHNGSLSQPGYT